MKNFKEREKELWSRGHRVAQNVSSELKTLLGLQYQKGEDLIGLKDKRQVRAARLAQGHRFHTSHIGFLILSSTEEISLKDANIPTVIFIISHYTSFILIGIF